jgi:hypothetical protein
MIDDAGFKPYGDTRLDVGCAVELTSGVLGGMTGVLVGFSRGHNCLIRLDGVQRGVLVVIDAASLKQCPSEKSASAACPVPALAPRHRRGGFDFTGV